MEKTENFSIKLVIVLVITVFALVSIIYLAQKDWSEKSFVCGNGIVEGREECDGNSVAHWFVGACDPSKYDHKCNNCKMECKDKEIVPVACTREYMPVCGMKDGKLQTFGNDCVAEADGVFDYSEGECPTVSGDLSESATCGNGIIESGEQCDGKTLLDYNGLSASFPMEEIPLCGCMPGTKTVYACLDNCQQTCHCEE